MHLRETNPCGTSQQVRYGRLQPFKHSRPGYQTVDLSTISILLSLLKANWMAQVFGPLRGVLIAYHAGGVLIAHHAGNLFGTAHRANGEANNDDITSVQCNVSEKWCAHRQCRERY